jgi:hypothetical protein
MAWFNRKITVTLIDDAKNKPIGVTEMPPADLPEKMEKMVSKKWCQFSFQKFAHCTMTSGDRFLEETSESRSAATAGVF